MAGMMGLLPRHARRALVAGGRRKLMVRALWQLLREAVEAFIEEDALSRGASISFYTVTSPGPVLFIVVGVGGLAFGAEAARGALTCELGGLMGRESAELIQAVLKNAAVEGRGGVASLVGAFILLITASGVFGEMQLALNVIWKAELKGSTVTRLVRARVVSLGLVAALGFLLMVSLVVSALLAGFADYINRALPFGALLLEVVNFIVSFLLIAVLFAAIYKVLPDVRLAWRDVVVGAIVTALLFNLGKSLIALYLSQSAIASSYGAAGAVIILLLWIYYSTQIFLLGAELTKVYARRRGVQAAARAMA